jgi:hypothetical protein
MARDEITPLILFQNNYSCKDGNLLDSLHYNFTVGSINSALFDLVNCDCYHHFFFVDLMFPLTTLIYLILFKKHSSRNNLKFFQYTFCLRLVFST